MMGDTSRVLVELHLPDVVRRRGFNVWPLAASLWSGGCGVRRNHYAGGRPDR